MTNPSSATKAALPSQVDVLVVGGGPAGLALSRHLKNAGVGHCLVEKENVAWSWRSMPDALRLVSPWWTNALRWQDVCRYPPFAKVCATQFTEYLEYFTRREGIDVIEHCAVHSIAARNGGGFEVATSLGDLRARMVVCSTGYFSFPAGPSAAPECDGTVPVLHAAQFPGPREARRIAGPHPIIVVGRRVSAGQIMTELAEFGGPVILSTRAPVEFRRDGLLGSIKDCIYYFYEEVLVLYRPRLKLPSFPVMDGGRSRELFEAGHVSTRPPIRRIHSGLVEFEDGQSIRAGLVINATGYRPNLPQVANGYENLDADGLPWCIDWESASSPGLFYLGLDNRRNFRSRTLRGIRRDSVVLAKVIADRLRHGPPGHFPDA